MYTQQCRLLYKLELKMEDPRVIEARVKLALAQLECETEAWATGAILARTLGELAPLVVESLKSSEARSARYESRAEEDRAEQKAEAAERRAERLAEQAERKAEEAERKARAEKEKAELVKFARAA